MTPENFVYWINGYLEIGNPKILDENQVKIIKDHIELVIQKQTPNRNTNQIQQLPIVYPATIMTCSYLTNTEHLTLRNF